LPQVLGAAGKNENKLYGGVFTWALHLTRFSLPIASGMLLDAIARSQKPSPPSIPTFQPDPSQTSFSISKNQASVMKFKSC
jgi:hypothetical protein